MSDSTRGTVQALFLFALLALPRIASAEDPSPETSEKKDDQNRIVAITDATIYPVGRGLIRRGSIVWRDGKITALGSEIKVPEGAQVIAGTGLSVCPGFVAILAAGLGYESSGGDIRHSLDPWDLELRIALANGITTAHVLRSGSGGFGQDGPVGSGTSSAVLKLTRGDLGAMFIKEGVYNFFSLPSRQLSIGYWQLRDRFRRAREYLRRVEEAKAKKEKPPRMDRDLGLYVQIVENKRPTVAAVADNREVRFLLDLQREYGFDLILNEPQDAWQVATDLVAANVGVIVKTRGRDFDFNLEGSVLEEGGMVPVRRAAAYIDAGVTTAIAPYRRGVSLQGIAGRDLTALPLDAAFAVRGGASEAEALASITIEPARLLGLGDRIGSLAVGKDADLLLLSGDPLDYRSFVLRAFIGGKEYYDRSASRLYRDIPLADEKAAPKTETP